MKQATQQLKVRQVVSQEASPSETGPRRYAKGVKRRQQILDRALEVFNDRGFEATSLRAIGEAIGVSHAALTHYFDSREELMLEVLREWDRRAEEFYREHHEEGTLDFAIRTADYTAQVPGLTALFAVMVARALEPGNQHSRAFFVQRYEAVRRMCQTMLEVGQANGQFRRDIPAEAAAYLVVGASDGMSTQWLLDPKIDLRAGMHLLETLLSPCVTDAKKVDAKKVDAKKVDAKKVDAKKAGRTPGLRPS